ncbi:MAG: extracellular solute-binding protein [Treponema sp.]|jgi:multiple sugar transport system substrate-binding protein|nr:extracellular solute-binding protein [Treponema sp.]
MKKRLLTVTALLVGAAMAFTGCEKSAGGAAQSGGAQAKVPLSYLAWNLGTVEENNLERMRLAAFQEAHPEVQLSILEIPKNADGTSQSYQDYMASLAAQANLPDVYMQSSVPEQVGKGWAYNASSLTANDPDFQKVIPAFKEGARINGQVYGLPNQAHLFGMAINLSIFEELNAPPLPFEYTVGDLRQAIARVSTNKYKGIDNFGIEDWGAASIDPSLGFGTFNASGFHFTSPAYAEALGVIQDVVARGQSGSGSFLPAASWLPEGVTWPWGEGYIALQYEATWSLAGFVNGERPFKADLMPLPGGKVVLVPDFIFIGANTKNPELAYELAKWMGFGETGQKKMVELAKAGGKQMPGIPLAPGAYPEVDAFFLQNYRGLTNFMKLYQMITEKPESILIEGYKIVPGYDLARFNADTGILGTVNGAQKSLTMGELITSIIRGERQLADYAGEMERIANAEWQKALQAAAGK